MDNISKNDVAKNDIDTPALAINHHIALLLSNLEICQLAIATLSIVAVAPFFPFGHLNYIRGYMEVVWPVPPGRHHSSFAACLHWPEWRQ